MAESLKYRVFEKLDHATGRKTFIVEERKLPFPYESLQHQGTEKNSALNAEAGKIGDTEHKGKRGTRGHPSRQSKPFTQRAKKKRK